VIAAADIRSEPPKLKLIVFGILALVLALRLANLSSAMLSPLSYQPGPDEDYYQRFGQAVAAGVGQNSPEFTSLDPAYGFLLGAIFKLVGVNLFAVYLLQALVDAATACAVLVIGRTLGRPRAGLYGALVYGVASSAIMYSATLLKATWVASFLAWWAAGALALIRSERRLPWLLFGGFCALGVALRSNLLLLALLSLLLPVFCARQGRTLRNFAAKSALLAGGMILAFLPWSIRNYHAYGALSPLPHNGGISLHQVYNAQNPSAELWVPAFVNYLHPSEIWRGYAAEASARAGHRLSPPEVDRYWRDEALGFIEQHPGETILHVLKKGLGFLSAREVPDNRSLAEEKLFSPVLRWLPSPTVWLFAMGLAGLVWLATEDRRWPIIAAPIAVSWLTVAIFFASDRFRFHAAPMLAVCSGVWIEHTIHDIRARRFRPLAQFALLAAVIAAVSIYLGSQSPPAAIRWDQIAWGYIKMGKIPQAQALGERIAAEQPDNGAILEALGYTAIARENYDEAASYYQRAIALRPRSHVAHYNLARALLLLGRTSQAEAEAKIAVSLNPSPDYQELLTKIQSAAVSR
jgi:4-amino-4-deoxy-L-arabinose transferase-like glycosyltransferase